MQKGYLDSLPQSESSLRHLYPATPHTTEGFLDVGDGHRVYYREYGHSEGLPALFLHGGPGAGCYPNHARFFDPQTYRIILMDQRGCGSTLRFKFVYFFGGILTVVFVTSTTSVFAQQLRAIYPTRRPQQHL
jgi:pimeloyl-ACP methyl ester carboxylesterase